MFSLKVLEKGPQLVSGVSVRVLHENMHFYED